MTAHPTRIYAIADVHGMAEKLTQLQQQIEADTAGFSGDIHVIFLGDYGDRGPNTKGVIETCLQWPLSQPNWHFTFLLGNHDHELLAFLENPKERGFLGYGGLATLASYGVNGSLGSNIKDLHTAFTDAFPASHKAFYKALVPFTEVGPYGFIHGGIEPHVPLEGQSLRTLLYARLPHLETPHHLPQRLVCGHTILPEPMITHDRICLDTGAYMGGPLTAAALETTTETVRLLQA